MDNFLRDSTIINKTGISSNIENYRIAIIGNQHVGKTTILSKYKYETTDATYTPTLGIDFLTKNVFLEDKTIKLVMWDTTGQERFKSLIPSYLKNANCVILTYDITDKSSFTSLNKWLSDIRDNVVEGTFIILCGNKIDLNNKRAISKEEGEKFSQENKIAYAEISATTGEGINELFNTIIGKNSNIKKKKIDKRIKLIIIYLCLIIFSLIKKQIILKCKESTYFTTWATSIYTLRSYLDNLNNHSIRQIIRISASGDKIRLKISNKSGEKNLEIKKICIADLISQNEVDTNTIKYLKFNGKNSVIIPKGEEIYSDTIMYPLKSISDIAISIYFGSVPKNRSGHYFSRTFSYIEKGYKITNRKFSEKNKISNWFFIEALEVSSENSKKTVVFFGDSITDGISGDYDTRNNYPDIFSAKIHEKIKISDIAVINQGISGDKITEKGIKRYAHDVLNIRGVKYIVVLYGVNDLNAKNKSSSQIISAYKSIIKQAHKKNLYIYSGTILPFSDYHRGYIWNKKKEKVRNEVNEWIRKTKPDKGGFDAFFDFDKEIKDPKNETRLADIYDCGDGIHPNLKGYQKMVDCIKDLSLFTKD